MEPATGDVDQCPESLEVLGGGGLGGSYLDADHVAIPLEDEVHLGPLGPPEVNEPRGIRVPGRLFEQLEPDEVLQQAAPQDRLAEQARPGESWSSAAARPVSTNATFGAFVTRLPRFVAQAGIGRTRNVVWSRVTYRWSVA
jgi:hypothetical protein